MDLVDLRARSKFLADLEFVELGCLALTPFPKPRIERELSALGTPFF